MQQHQVIDTYGNTVLHSGHNNLSVHQNHAQPTRYKYHTSIAIDMDEKTEINNEQQ